MLPPARFFSAAAGLALSTALATTACGAAPQASTPSGGADAYAVVRATSEAAFSTGKQHLDRGELEAALVDLDQAKVNDPDGRDDIQSALDATLDRLRASAPLPAASPSPGLPLPSPSPTVASSPSATPSSALAPALVDRPGFKPWQDQAGRFRIQVPDSWNAAADPQAEFGKGIVSFTDPGGNVSFTVAGDDSAGGSSPELYAAKMELAMQQIQGYALEGVTPDILAGSPSVRRSFSVMRSGPSGPRQYRGFQAVLIHGNVAYILTGLAPARDYAASAAALDTLVSSFAFL